MTLREGYARAGVLFVLIVGISLTYFSYKTVLFLKSVPMHYYNTLPLSTSGDLDRDGILDYYDDSDGDGIADNVDPTPF